MQKTTLAKISSTTKHSLKSTERASFEKELALFYCVAAKLL
jgi:hypothetical protein